MGNTCADVLRPNPGIGTGPSAGRGASAGAVPGTDPLGDAGRECTGDGWRRCSSDMDMGMGGASEPMRGEVCVDAGADCTTGVDTDSAAEGPGGRDGGG